ncbi:MAG: protein kinase [Myxococcaceae bacterium]
MSACQHCGREHPANIPKCPQTNEPMSQPGLIGTKVDRYQVERLLGAGGFGSVYKAQHIHTGQMVALKLLKKSLGADAGMLERFLREARAAAAVGSEHIVKVNDAGLSPDGQAFLALEFLDGMDLNELAQRERPLPHVRVAMIALQVLEGLGAAHARGIVHRDMKPANVFITRRRDERGTERDFVKLLDFGISKMHGDAGTSGLTMTGVAMGTPSYMAPEQFFDARSVDARADVYSVSAMLYELLSGRLPLDAESYAHLIVKVRTELPVPLNQVAPQVPMPLAQVVTVGLAKDPAQRWQSAKEFSDALRSSLAMAPAGSTPAFLPSSSSPRPPIATPVAQPPPPASRPPSQPAQPIQLTPPPAQPPAGGDIGFEATRTPQPSSGWVVPVDGSANTGLPLSLPTSSPPGAPIKAAQPSVGSLPVNVVSAPGQLGAQAPVQPAVMTPTPGAPPPQKSQALKWVLIVLGLIVLGGGCCTCAVVGEAIQKQKQQQEQNYGPP